MIVNGTNGDDEVAVTGNAPGPRATPPGAGGKTTGGGEPVTDSPRIGGLGGDDALDGAAYPPVSSRSL